MKAEELQIWDWIVYDGPLQIEGISDTNEVYIDQKILSCEEIQPIPLTDAVLKLNGWKDSEYSNILKLYRKDGVYMELRHDNLAVWLDVAGEMPIDTYADYILPKSKSVHELQHCLRLVGLNKLADKFKVPKI